MHNPSPCLRIQAIIADSAKAKKQTKINQKVADSSEPKK